MARIGILNCTNTTQDIGCSAFGCLKSVNERSGKFGLYKDDEKVELVGIINCAGCPTAIAPEKILNRIRTITAAGVDAIHISGCIERLCPFKNKYKSIIEENFPDIKVVMGTHDMPDGEMAEQAAEAMKGLLCTPKMNMAELIQKAGIA